MTPTLPNADARRMAPQLRLQQRRTRQAQADGAQAERRIVLRREVKIVCLFIRADVERADDDLPAVHGLHELLVAGKQLVLRRIAAAAEIEKFAPEQAHALRAALLQQRQIVCPGEIRVQADGVARPS